MMLRHIIFHLNILVDPAFLRAHYQLGLAAIMYSRYGKSQEFWVDIQEKIFADWASYHSDLNFSSDHATADMREARYRVTRALFRLAQIPEPPKPEITQLAADLIANAPKSGDAFFHDSHDVLAWCFEENLSIAIVSYHPESQLRAILCGAHLEEKLAFAIGADTFEHYDMDSRYFVYLLNTLKSKPENCLYVDNQETVLANAEKLGMKVLRVEPHIKPRSWMQQLPDLLA